jgi:protein O-mannosyl-transferase
VRRAPRVHGGIVRGFVSSRDDASAAVETARPRHAPPRERGACVAQPHWSRGLLPAAVVAAVALGASANTLWNGFVYDDVQNVLRNPWLREPHRLGEAFTHHAAAFDSQFRTSFFRPLMHVIYAAVIAAAGFEAWAFHAVNLLAHAAVSVCVYALLRRWTEAGNAARGRLDLALVGALVFAVHPIHAEAVAWIAGITDLSYSCLGLAGFLLLTREPVSRRSVAFGLTLLFGAMLCKEPAIVLAGVVGVAMVARGDLRTPLGRHHAFRVVGGLAAIAFTYLLLRGLALGGMAGGDRRVDVTAVTGVATAIALLGTYFVMLLAPTGLTPIHDFRVVTTLADARLWGGIAILSAVGGLVWMLRKRPGALVGAALLVFPLLPATYVPALGEGLFAERYLYLPLAGALLLAVVAVEELSRWKKQPSRPIALGARAAIAAVLVACTAATYTRNAVWRNALTLWSDAVEKTPSSAAAHELLGFAQLTSGEPANAVETLSRVLALDPERVDARLNLGSALAAVGRLDEAGIEIERALPFRPTTAEAYGVLGYIRASQNRLDDAAWAYGRALQLNPMLADVHHGLAIVAANRGDLAVALVHFQEAVRLDPGNAMYHANLSRITQ